MINHTLTYHLHWGKLGNVRDVGPFTEQPCGAIGMGVADRGSPGVVCVGHGACSDGHTAKAAPLQLIGNLAATTEPYP